MAEHIVDTMRQESLDRNRAYMERQAVSKSTMRFAWVQISARKYAVLEYDGGSYLGDFAADTGRFDHRFRMVKTGVSWAEKEQLMADLISGKVRPEDFREE